MGTAGAIMKSAREAVLPDRTHWPETGELRAAFGQFATGVAVMTTRAADGRRVGLTVNSFTSVSLDPPLVLWCLARTAASLPAFLTAPRFAINVLSIGQRAIAQRFASREVDRFAGVETSVGLGGMPLLPGAIAHFVCRRVDQHAAGDHVVFVGEVEHFERLDGDPLVFHGGNWRSAAPLEAHGT
jgi:flavin reductase (DIM6/NTAB) family NADH-FMN oxidoreductase RutF